MTDMREAVVWAYRLILGREPEDEAVVRDHASAYGSVEDMRRAFLGSDEFNSWSTREQPNAPGAEVLLRFPAWQGEGEAGFWRDFLGVRTRCAFMGENYQGLSGAVEGPPGTETHRIHDTAEWIGTLRSVVEAEATGRLVVIELGAGWGPWLVGAAYAARQRGIGDVRLVGVEGSRHHFAFMEQHFADNGLDPAAHLLIHGVVGAADGVARFPVLRDPRNDWSAEADYAASAPRKGRRKYEEVPCFALETLLADLPPVDLIHCDVQGAEYEVMQAAVKGLQTRVRRVVIGTHSRQIEADLLALFGRLGWRLENEGACELEQTDGIGVPVVAKDGYQVWSNPGDPPRKEGSVLF